ncbi:hypothetical protein BN871_AI_01560 [Paenibacillus sp. P22]|nr:hypothetical protein BN871_AI_01560 [Paenibacillus sp. P22]
MRHAILVLRDIRKHGQLFLQVTEIAPDKRHPVHVRSQPDLGVVVSPVVLVEGDQPAFAGEPGSDQLAMPRAAERTVDIYAVRTDIQALYGLFLEYGNVMKQRGVLLMVLDD